MTGRDFNSFRTDKPGSGIKLDCTVESSTLVVSFAAIPGQTGKSEFAFVRLLSDLPVKKAWFHDPHVRLYHCGVPGVGDTADEIVSFIRQLRSRENIRRVIMLGNSTGGYAAILFGILAGADDVHAISPCTRFTDYADVQESNNLDIMTEVAGRGSVRLDLRALHEQKSNGTTSINIYYAHGNSMDRRHALHMQGLTGVRLFRYPFGGHTLAHYLAKTHCLRQVLEASIAGEQARLRKSPTGALAGHGFRARSLYSLPAIC
ncbi:MAG: hypothetical protein ACKVRP_01095 [Bacteroidota bacterium]